MTICPPESLYLRLPVVSELTGCPESTLRDAISTGDLRGMQVVRAFGSPTVVLESEDAVNLP